MTFAKENICSNKSHQNLHQNLIYSLTLISILSTAAVSLQVSSLCWKTGICSSCSTALRAASGYYMVVGHRGIFFIFVVKCSGIIFTLLPLVWSFDLFNQFLAIPWWSVNTCTQLAGVPFSLGIHWQNCFPCFQLPCLCRESTAATSVPLALGEGTLFLSHPLHWPTMVKAKTMCAMTKQTARVHWCGFLFG